MGCRLFSAADALMARTQHLQADESIRCTEVAEADAETRPWTILTLITNAPGTDPTWRVVGTYPTQNPALGPPRRFSRPLGSFTAAPPRWGRPPPATVPPAL